MSDKPFTQNVSVLRLYSVLVYTQVFGSLAYDPASIVGFCSLLCTATNFWLYSSYTKTSDFCGLVSMSPASRVLVRGCSRHLAATEPIYGVKMITPKKQKSLRATADGVQVGLVGFTYICTGAGVYGAFAEIPPPSLAHNVARKINKCLQADATHELYWANGDTGPQLDPSNHGQDPNTLHGSITRIVVDSQMGSSYTVPSSNPFSGGGEFRHAFCPCLPFVTLLLLDPTVCKLMPRPIPTYSTDTKSVCWAGKFGPLL